MSVISNISSCFVNTWLWAILSILEYSVYTHTNTIIVTWKNNKNTHITNTSKYRRDTFMFDKVHSLHSLKYSYHESEYCSRNDILSPIMLDVSHGNISNQRHYNYIAIIL